MEQSNNTSLQKEKQKRRRILPVPLLLLALISTSIVGFILGRSVGTEPLGQIIDTILLSPEKSDDMTPPRGAFHLTGRVYYSDGTPAAGRVLELHSDPMTTTSDSAGGFLFANAPEGEHTIIVLDDHGAVAARREIEILRDDSVETVHVDLKEDGAYVIEMAIDIRVLEIAIELDDETLFIDPSLMTCATREGLVMMETGVASIYDGPVLSPGGNVYLPDGSIVLPGGAAEDPTYIIQSDDTVVINQTVYTDSARVTADGTVILPDGTEIRPGGQIVTPDSAEQGSDEGGGIGGDGTEMPVIDTPPESGNTQRDGDAGSGGEADSSGEGDESGDNGNSSGDSGSYGENSGSAGEESDSGNSGSPEDNDETGDNDETRDNGGSAGEGSDSEDNGDSSGDNGGSTGGGGSSGDAPPAVSDIVYGENRHGDYVQWTQNSTIDLFYRRISGMREQIAPGSAGYYQFRLKNTQNAALSIKITLAENGLHLPLVFTLTPLNDEGNKQSDQAVTGVLSANGGLVLETGIAESAVVTYRLDWEWPLEGNDALDTQIGSGDNLVYLLSMTVHAEEV